MPTCEGGYKAFKIGELFDVRTSKSIDKDDLKVTSNNVSSFQFIGRTSVNNGIQAYTEKLSFQPNPANTFSVIQVGESVMQFRDAQWYSSQNIFLLLPLDNRLITCKLYVIASTNKALTRFNGGYNDYPTLKSLKDLCITLPTLRNGEIDFAFMEQWVRGLEEERVREIQEEHNRKLKAYLQAAGFDDCTMSAEENEVQRAIAEGRVRNKKVKASELFDIQGNPQLNKESFVFGEQSSYPYFTRTVFNNGILGYVDYLDDSHLIKGNSLAVGMMGMQFFYMQHDFYAGQFTKTAFPKFNALDEHIALYFITQLNKMKEVYLSVLVRDFEKVFNNTELSLPITASGEIDYAFMGTAIRAMEKQCIARLKEAFMHEQEVYRQVTDSQ